MTDIISAIDSATGCHQCGNPLGSSPSSDFCSEFCQATWHEKRVKPGVVSEMNLHGTGLSIARPVNTYRRDGERWVEFGQTDGRIEPLAHYNVDFNGDIVSNMDELRSRASSNADIQGWIAPEVWDSLHSER